MNRFLSLSSLVLLTLSAFSTPLWSQDAPKALMFIRGGSADWEYMLREEAGVMYQTLEAAGIKVEVATASGDPISAGSVNYTPDFRLSDVDITEYAAVILPCMAASRFVDPGATRMVREAADAGKLIAAQFNSVYTLAEAGLLEGKKYAHLSEIDSDRFPGFAEAEYAGSGIVRDGNLMTSGICPYMARSRGVPHQTEEFTQALADAIKGQN